MYYFLLFYSVLISTSTFSALAIGLRSQKQKRLKEIIASVVQKIEGAEEEMEREIDHRLDDVIVGFKIKIPMIGVFLSKSKESELKETARIELMKLVPALKQRFLQKFMKSSEDSSLSFEQQLNLQSIQLVDSLWNQVKYPLFCIAISVGVILGLIEIMLIHLMA